MSVVIEVERRQIVRVPVHEPVRFTVITDGRVRDGTVRDIGIGGAFVETAEPGPFGSPVRIAIEIASEPFVLDGVIRWVRSSGMGVQFLSLGVRETHAITELARLAAEQRALHCAP